MRYRKLKVLFWSVAIGALCYSGTMNFVSGLASPRPANQESSSPEQKFRARDEMIQSQFKEAVAKKRKDELSMEKYSKLVKKLRKQELKLFADVEKHQFKDQTEYNYWHRGRMKFPSVLASEAQWLKKKEGPAPSDSMQL